MNKFITPVSMQVTKEQYYRDLENPLVNLGYVWEDWYWKYDFSKQHPLLVNYYNSKLGNLGALSLNEKYRDGAYFIDDYNPELFLALAAMTDDTEFKKGDLIFYTKNTGETSWLIFDKKIISNNPAWNYIYYTSKEGGETNDFIANRDYEKSMRKATKEEIIQHFTKNKQMNKNQEIIGYEIKKNLFPNISNYDILKVIANLGLIHTEMDNPNEEQIKKDLLLPDVQRHFKSAGVFDTWFEPVYGPKEIIINGYKAEFSKGQVKFGCKTITKDQIQGLISTLELTKQLGSFDISDKGIDNENFAGLTVNKELLQTILEKI